MPVACMDAFRTIAEDRQLILMAQDQSNYFSSMGVVMAQEGLEMLVLAMDFFQAA